MSRHDDIGMGIGGFLAGAVIGGAIGAGVALLFAPRSGEETRRILKKKAEAIGEDITEFKEELEPKVKKAKKQLAAKFS